MFKYKYLALAVASVGAMSVANAAGLDRSGQDVSAFLQDGTYGEVVYTYIDADVSGKDTAGNTVSDIAEAYDFGRFGVKADINDTFSVGVLYDEPFGAAVQYRGDNNFVSAGGAATYSALVGQAVASAVPLARASQVPQLASAANVANRAEIQKGEGTNVEIRTQNATLLLGAKFGQNKNFQIYGGPQAQRLTGEVHLRGTAYAGMNGYDAQIGADMGYGWVAGVAYSKPEIGLKAALTYRSEIEHERSIAESVPAVDYNSSQLFKVTLPESYNLDFQTGLNPTTLLTAKVRYVPWGDFEIRPPAYGDTTARVGKRLPIVAYDKDQWSGELGLAKRLNDKLAVQGSVGYDSGAGSPVSSLGPIKGYYTLGLGTKYNVTPEWSVSLGAKYFMFGDTDAKLPNDNIVGRFEDNDGYAVGLKLAYQKK